MYLKQHEHMFSLRSLRTRNLRETIQNCSARRPKFSLDRLYPIEEILLLVNFTVDSGGLTLVSSPYHAGYVRQHFVAHSAPQFCL